MHTTALYTARRAIPLVLLSSSSTAVAKWMNLSVDTFDTFKPSSQKVVISFSFVQYTQTVIHQSSLFVSVKQVYEKKKGGRGKER